MFFIWECRVFLAGSGNGVPTWERFGVRGMVRFFFCFFFFFAFFVLLFLFCFFLGLLLCVSFGVVVV